MKPSRPNQKLQELLGTALIGTGREAVAAPDQQSSNSVDKLLATKSGASTAHTLLTQAGVYTLYQQIGQENLHRLPPPETTVAPPFRHQPMPEPATNLLRDLCENSELSLLQDFLIYITKEQWHIPSEQLPRLLTLGRKNSRLRPFVTEAMDDVGRWLARQQSDWHYALWPENNWDGLLDQFKHSASNDRLPLLRWCRQNDPARGLRLLKDNWSLVPDGMRTQLLQALQDQLSELDEPFLERCLDDRHITTRRKAQELLASIPTSNFSQRMITHGRLFMQWHPRRKTPLTVSIPSEHTVEMQRDGITNMTEKKQSMYLSKRLTTLAGAIPLDYWTDPANNIGLDIPHFLELVSLSKWTRTLLTGLVAATHRQKRPDWAHALIQWGWGGSYEKLTLRNTNLLTPEQFTELVDQACDEQYPKEPLKTNNLLTHLLRSWKRPWPEPAAILMLQVISHHLSQQHPEKTPDAGTKNSIRQFFSLIPADLASEANKTMAQHKGLHPHWKSTIDRGLKTLRYRQELEEITKRK